MHGGAWGGGGESGGPSTCLQGLLWANNVRVSATTHLTPHLRRCMIRGPSSLHAGLQMHCSSLASSLALHTPHPLLSSPCRWDRR